MMKTEHGTPSNISSIGLLKGACTTEIKHKWNRHSPETDLKEKQTAASQSARFFHRFRSVSDLFQCFRSVSDLFQDCFRSVSVSLRRRTRFTEVGNLLLLSGHRFPRNRRFFGYSAKTGSDGAKLFQVSFLVPTGLFKGACARAIGLPV